MHTTARHAGIRKSVSMQSAQANEWEQDERVRSSTTERNWHLQTGFFGIHSLQQFANFAAILSVQENGYKHTLWTHERSDQSCANLLTSQEGCGLCFADERAEGFLCVQPQCPKQTGYDAAISKAGRFTAYYLALSTFSCQKNVRRRCNEPF